MDARSCDSTWTSLLLHRWVWSRKLKRIFTQPYNSIHNTCLWVKVRLTSEARGPIYYYDSKPVTIFNRSIVTRKNIAADSNESSFPKREGLDSPKKNERLVRIINTRHMLRRVDLHCTPSPVLLD